MRVPRLGLKDIVFMAGQMISEDHPKDSLEPSESAPDAWPTKINFFYQSQRFSSSIFAFLRALLLTFSSNFLFQPSIGCLKQPSEITIRHIKYKQYLNPNLPKKPPQLPPSHYRHPSYFAYIFISLYTYLFLTSKTNILIINKMQAKTMLAIFVVLLLARAQEPEIIDFTYTHVLQEGGASSDLTDQIIIFPDTKQIQKYSFPEICELKDKLDQGMDQSSTATSSIDVDEHLKGLRAKILQLLRLTEEMKNIRAALSQIQEDYEPSLQGFNSSHFSSDLKRLAEKQLELVSLKGQVEKLTLKLNNLIEQYNLNPKSQQFNQVNIQYKISFANSKINFYSNLKKSIQNKKASQHPINFNQFFADLEAQFININSHLDDIDSVINNYAIKKNLEQKIASWNNKIEIEKLLLNEKVDCNTSKGKIKNHNHFNEEIKKTFQDLRQKKKEFNGMNNTQCEGVAKKLEEKVRSELKIINRAYICSQGLEEIQRNLKVKEFELQNLKQKLDDLKLGELEVYQKNYNKTVADISKEFEEMKTFTVDEYVHNEAEIDQLLEEAKRAKQNAERDLKTIPEANYTTTNFKDLEKLVQEIKKEKAKYCKQYSAYEQESRQTWNKIYREEKQQRQLAHLRSQYVSYGQKFLSLQTEYKQISNEIIMYLQKHTHIE